jgi:hypothetical protein
MLWDKDTSCLPTTIDLAVVETQKYESADASGRRRKQLFETMYGKEE